jgi:hypothetical protein
MAFLMSIIFFFQWMNGERYGQKSNTHSSRGETKDAGTLVAPKFFGRKYKKTTSPAQHVCVRAHRLQYI